MCSLCLACQSHSCPRAASPWWSVERASSARSNSCHKRSTTSSELCARLCDTAEMPAAVLVKQGHRSSVAGVARCFGSPEAARGTAAPTARRRGRMLFVSRMTDSADARKHQCATAKSAVETSLCAAIEVSTAAKSVLAPSTDPPKKSYHKVNKFVDYPKMMIYMFIHGCH